MKEDFFVDEQEIAVATNEIVGLAYYLASTLERYENIMTSVKDVSIREDKICESLDEIIKNACSYQADMLKLADEFQKNIISKELCDVEEHNSYSFPDDPDLMGIELLTNNYVEGM